MDKLVKIAVLDNEIEARLLSAILDEHDIPHILKSYSDLAYDGLFQTQKGWGFLIGPESQREEIARLLTELRQAAEE